jgi:hypothetical protein
MKEEEAPVGPAEEEGRSDNSSELACSSPFQDQASVDQCSQDEKHRHLV